MYRGLHDGNQSIPIRTGKPASPVADADGAGVGGEVRRVRTEATKDVAGSATPRQQIGTVDEPASRLGDQVGLFNPAHARPDEFRNRLIWGDNKLVMASLLRDFKGKIDLIYIAPPFDVGADFTMNVPIGDEVENVGKDQSTLEMVTYRDMWGKG